MAKEAYVDGANLFKDLQKGMRKCTVEDLDNEAEHAPVAWEFIIGFAAKKSMYRRQIIQIINQLTESSKWLAAFEAHTALHEKVKDLHEELQAALGLQHEALEKAIAPGALKSMAMVAQEERPEHVKQAIQKEKLVEEIKEQAPTVDGFDSLAGPAGDAEEDDSASGQTAAMRALQEGIDLALALDDDAKLDMGGLSALTKLRIGVIQCAGDVAAFDKEVEHAHQVFSFLLHYAGRNSSAVAQVAEVMNQLMAAPSWAAAFEASPLLRADLLALPEDAQAALGLQHEKVLQLTSAEAQSKANAGTVSDAVKMVAPKMQSVRLPAGTTVSGGAPAGPPVATVLPSASPEMAPPPPPPPPPPVGNQWKEARTPQGHTYYYNKITRESTWKRPDELGGPITYQVGDEIEVWSNSQKVWGIGKVEKVDGDKVMADFVLPDGTPGKKELQMQHRDLRKREKGASATEGFSSAEQALYQRLFNALPGDTRVKGPKEVGTFLLTSGAKRRTLSQVWAVAIPTGKAEVEYDDFARCCRLVAHCQVLGLKSEMVADGDRPLRVALRTCLFREPPKLPEFS